MALKIWGVESLPTGIEFIVRADSETQAKIVTTFLQGQMAQPTALNVADFSEPILLEGTLISSDFPKLGIVNGKV